MTYNTFLIVGPTMATVAAGRINLAVNPVHGQIITSVRDFPIRSVAKLH
jgi:hypothetical protein